MEVLTRIGRNQVFGTLFLFFGAFLLAVFEPRLQVLLPAAEFDSTELFTRIVVLVSGGFFAGFLFEHSLAVVGQRITRMVCESARYDVTKYELQQEEADLDVILKGEPMVSTAIRGKPALVRFIAVAKYLSQERFKDFPELSPLRDFEQAVTFSVASVVFAGLAVAGVVSALVKGTDYLIEGREVVLALCLLLSILLWFDAQRHYDEGRESTLVSMREKRAEADKALKEAAERERTAEAAKRATQAEAEARRLRIELLNRDVSAAVAEIDSDTASKRIVAVTNLGSALLRPSYSLDALGEPFDNFMVAVRLARNLYDRSDGAALDSLLRTIRNVLRATESLSVYETVEKELTALLVEIISRQPFDSPFFNIALLAAEDLRSPALVDAILSRATKDDPEKSLPKLILEQTLGTSALGHFNKDRLVAAFKANPMFGDNSRLRAATTSILSSLAQPAAHKQNWPKVVQKLDVSGK